MNERRQREEEVRRLLADARHTEPVPDDVVARLDDVLAGLAAEPARVAPVTQLAHRRRTAGRLLMAAAAVVVLGVGVSQVVDGAGSGGADAGSANESAVSGSDGGGADQDGPAESFGGSDSSTTSEDEGEATQGYSSQSAPAAKLARLRSGQFSTDVEELRALPGLPALDRSTLRAEGADALVVACNAEAWGKGRFVAVRYDRAPAVLVFRRVSGDTQVADLFLCGDTVPERSVTLPAP